MAVIDTLKTGKDKGEEAVTFYHISTDVNAFKSFFKEGAKSFGKGVGGQTDGFYVWTNEKSAEEHIRFLDNKGKGLADKSLTGNEALIIGVTIPKASISYPLWQQDMEGSFGIYRLLTEYGDFLNANAHDLNIPLKDNTCFVGKISTITSFSFKKTYSNLYKKDFYDITVDGLNEKGEKKKDIFGVREDELDRGAEDSLETGWYQILTDWMCQNNPNFKKDFDALMMKRITQGKGCALKYTGSDPLPISFAQHVRINADGSLKRTTVFDVKKGSNQVCPFLTMELAREKDK